MDRETDQYNYTSYHLNKNQNKNIKLHITFGTRGFFIHTTDQFTYFDYNNVTSLTYDIDQSCVTFCRGALDSRQNSSTYRIYCGAQDGNWFMKNYVNCGDVSIEHRMMAVEDKLKVLTEIMDQKGM